MRATTAILRFLAHAAELLLLVLVVVAVTVTLRLAAGPIPLDALTPWLAGRIERAGPLSITFTHPALAWSQAQAALQLRVQDLELRAKDGGSFVAAAPVVAIRVDLPSLVKHGALRLREVEVRLPALQLVRETGQRLVLTFGGKLGALPLEEATGGGMLGRLLAGGGEGAASDPRLSRLHRIVIDAESLSFEDRPSGRRIDSRAATLRLTRDVAGWQLRLDVDAIGGTPGSRLRLAADPLPGSAEQAVALALERVPLAAFDGLVPQLPLAGVALPVSAALRLRFDPKTLTPGPGTFQLTAAAGTIPLPTLLEAPIELRRLELAGHADAGWRRIDLDAGELRLAAAAVRVTGHAERDGEHRALALDLVGEGVNPAIVTGLWPLPLAPKTRQWVVEHVAAGTVPTAHLDLVQALDATAPPGRPLLTLRFAVRDGATRFLADWPPAEGLSGEAELAPDRFTMELADGHVGEIASRQGRLTFTGLRGEAPVRLELSLDAAGEAGAVLELLGHRPIRLPDRLGIQPKAVSGKVEGSLSLGLPLHADLKSEEVARHVTARLSDGAVRQIRKGYDASDGTLAIAVDAATVDIAGELRLNAVPARLHWHERLDAAPLDARQLPPRRRIEVAGSLDQVRARSLGFTAWPEGVDGAVAVTALVTQAERPARHYEVTGDLAALTVTLPELGLLKAAGEPGTAQLALDQPDEHHLAIADASAGWGEVRLHGGAALRLDPAGWDRVDLREVHIPTADLASAVLQHETGTVRAALDAERLDLRPYLAARKPGAPPGPEGEDLVLDAKAARLFIGAEPLTEVALHAERRAGELAGLAVTTRLPGQGKTAALTLSADPLPGSFSAETQDLGALLRGLDIHQSRIEGGRGHVAGSIEGQGQDRVWTGDARLRDLSVRDAPLLARLFTLASFQGLVDTLSGSSGLAVERVSIPFAWSPGSLELKGARVVGSGLGARVEGGIDLARRTLALSGTVAPVYALNHLLGQIPIVGNLMRGQSSDALLAATFSIGGSVAEPVIQVNPLAALVPGFLRDLFGDLLDNGQPPAGSPIERD